MAWLFLPPDSGEHTPIPPCATAGPQASCGSLESPVCVPGFLEPVLQLLGLALLRAQPVHGAPRATPRGLQAVSTHCLNNEPEAVTFLSLREVPAPTT